MATRPASEPVRGSAGPLDGAGVAVGLGLGVGVGDGVGVGVGLRSGCGGVPLSGGRLPGVGDGPWARAAAGAATQAAHTATSAADRTAGTIGGSLDKRAVAFGAVLPRPLASSPLMEASPVEQVAPVAPTLRARVDALRRSDTASAAGLAIATIIQQLGAVAFTVVFTRILSPTGYGSLGALVNLTVILLVPGSALQVVAARQGTLGRLGQGGELAATLDRWTRHILAGLLAVTVISVLARSPLSALINVHEQWAAAAVPVSAALWLLLSVQRGLLQSRRAYKPVAYSLILESVGRMGGALVMVAVGLAVTGAFLGLLFAYACIAVALHRELRRQLGPAARGARQHPLSSLARHAAFPIAGLVLVAALQNIDVIMARHSLDSREAGVYAATTVAAKFVVWVAIGIGMWVLPEATRRAAAGRDPRSVLGRALGIIGALAVPALAIFAFVPRLLLRVAFGAKYLEGDTVLLTLGIAFALLAATYLSVQFLLGLHRRLFVGVLAVATLAEPVLLYDAGSLKTFAVRVLIVQAVAALAMVGMSAFVRRDDRAGGEPVL
jgi:O-antigen/teichoic acid export membrane protein